MALTICTLGDPVSMPFPFRLVNFLKQRPGTRLFTGHESDLIHLICVREARVFSRRAAWALII